MKNIRQYRYYKTLSFQTWLILTTISCCNIFIDYKIHWLIQTNTTAEIYTRIEDTYKWRFVRPISSFNNMWNNWLLKNITTSSEMCKKPDKIRMIPLKQYVSYIYWNDNLSFLNNLSFFDLMLTFKTLKIDGGTLFKSWF